MALAAALNGSNQTSNSKPGDNHLDSTSVGYRNTIGTNALCYRYRDALD